MLSPLRDAWLRFSVGCAGSNVEAYSRRHGAAYHPRNPICIDDWTATLSRTTRWLQRHALCPSYIAILHGMLAPRPANIIVPILGRYP
jgi:hypothetical protein